MPDTKIDTSNKFIIGAIGNDLNIMRPVAGRISHDDALNLAAWLVALADPTRDEFDKVHEAICNT